MTNLPQSSLTHASDWDPNAPTYPAWLDRPKYTLLEHGERLVNGIWPTSVAIWATVVYVALFILRPWEKLFPLLATIHFERLCALIVLAVILSSRGFRFRLDQQTVGVLLFFGAVVVSAIFAWRPQFAWAGANGVYVLATIVLVYFVITSVVRTPYELVFLLACYLVVMGAYLAKCQWEYFVHGAGGFSMEVMRLRGMDTTFAHPNSVAASTVLSLTLWYFLFEVRGVFCCTWTAFWRNWFFRGLLIFLALAVTSIILTKSRTGMLGLVVFVGLLVMRGRTFNRKVSLTLAGVILLAGTWVFMPDEAKDRMRTIWNPKAGPISAHHSTLGRVAGFLAGVEMFRRYPTTGVGIGNFVEYRIHHVDGVKLASHSLIGQVLGQTGLVGTSAFCFMVYVMLSNSRKVKVLRPAGDDITLATLSKLSLAIQDSVLLLLFLGMAGSCLFRFNWYWLAAFGALSLQFAEAICHRQCWESQQYCYAAMEASKP